jgi:hypothetical protein
VPIAFFRLPMNQAQLAFVSFPKIPYATGYILLCPSMAVAVANYPLYFPVK